jgi:hypothetical protein
MGTSQHISTSIQAPKGYAVRFYCIQKQQGTCTKHTIRVERSKYTD